MAVWKKNAGGKALKIKKKKIVQMQSHNLQLENEAISETRKTNQQK